MEKRILAFLLLAGWFSGSTTFAQNTTTFLSPGVKLGYTFGDNGGFTYGFEVSFVWMDRSVHNIGNSMGPVFDIDFWPGATRLHLGLELVKYDNRSGIASGACFGPSIVFKESQPHFGVSFIPFFGALAYPYFNYTRVNDFTFLETGLYGKAHIHTGSGVFNLIH